jgi:hypothetical protein
MAFDRHNPTHLSQLKSEVNTDPDTLGYDTTVVKAGVLDVINLKRAAYTIAKPKISAAAVRSAVNFTVYDNTLPDKQEYLRWITGSNGTEEESLIVTDALRQDLAGDPTADGSIWQPTNRTAMNQAMLDLIDVDGSRAQDLWGFDTRITEQDWIDARDS